MVVVELGEPSACSDARVGELSSSVYSAACVPLVPIVYFCRRGTKWRCALCFGYSRAFAPLAFRPSAIAALTLD